MTTKDEIRQWLKRQKNGFMLVVCDTFDHEDYPVFCDERDFSDQYSEHDGKNMQTIMEVYDLSLDHEEQLNERRAFHFPRPIE